jgi:predicted double-glycine peptidase
MLELKRYAERLGYVAQGYLVEDASKLERVKIPYLTLIDVRGYMHFVVVKRVSAGRVFIADPAFGNRTTDLETFERGWTQKILGVMSATNAGIADFAEHAALEGRPQDVPLLTDYGLRPIPPTPGSFR